MALYTGKGDAGTTTLFNTPKGTRFSKSAPIFESLGMCDELNTLVGLAKAAAREDATMLLGVPLEHMLHAVQDTLFTVQAELAGAPKSVSEAVLKETEAHIHFIEKILPPITSFLVPGATELSARLDVARAVSRRVERSLVRLQESGEGVIATSTLQYMNRLSSLLYAYVRYVNHVSAAPEVAPLYR